jgi:branched-chain amino acid transport system substrate-binding protein
LKSAATRTVTGKRLLGALALSAVVVAGCSSSSKSSTGSTSSTSSTTASSSSKGGTASSYASYMANYVGGKVGQASGSPIDIGWVNTDTGVAPFADTTAAAEAAVSYINANLNGINGHVVKLVTCNLSSEEAGQACGTEMLNNSNIKTIGMGVDVVGGDAFFKVINNQKVVTMVTQVSPSDFDPYPTAAHQNAYILNAGPLGALTGEMKYVGQYMQPKPKNVLVVSIAIPASEASVQLIAGVLKPYGITPKVVNVPPTAAGPQVISAIQAGGGASADLFIVNAEPNICAGLYNYEQQNGLHTPTVDTGGCIGSAMKSLTGKYEPDNWLIADTGANIVAPQDDQFYALEYQQFGHTNPPQPFPDAHAFIMMLNLTRAMNAAGADASVQQISSAITSMQAPVADNTGPLTCGSVKTVPPVCGTQIGVVESTSSGYTRLVPSSQVPSITAFSTS